MLVADSRFGRRRGLADGFPNIAAEGVEAVTTCRVPGFASQAFYKWNAQPYSDLEWDDAQLLNEIVDLDADDPEFRFRLLHDEPGAAGRDVGANRVHRLCRENDVCRCSPRRRARLAMPGHRFTTTW